MKYNDLITCREVELVLLEKGQRSRRYKLGDVWELNFDEIREALSEYQPKIVRCKDCKHYKDGFCYNPNTYDDEKTRGNTSPNWFCADGERRDDDD